MFGLIADEAQALGTTVPTPIGAPMPSSDADDESLARQIKNDQRLLELQRRMPIKEEDVKEEGVSSTPGLARLVLANFPVTGHRIASLWVH